ncbi:MAG: GNAT family N-acetyltransferase [Opitutaceae bacterium]
MNVERDGFLISTEPELLDLDFICHGLNTTYWAKNRSQAIMEKAIQHSVCFGVYDQATGKQVGFARVVTDQATFSWVCDVFITEPQRAQGLGKWLMSCVTDHPMVKSTVSLLGTLDAHGLYQQFGYVKSEQMKRLPNP